MRKHLLTIAAALAAALALTGCAQKQPDVSVMQVSMLSSASRHGEKFAGVVVSENAVQIPKDPEKTVKELHVAVGDEVHTGDRLFSYDSEELSLAIDRQNLDLERLKGTVAEKQRQLSEAEKRVSNTSGNEKLEWDLKRMELQADLTQAKYDQTAKEKEIESTRSLLENVDIFSPVDGTVRKIEDANAQAFLVIQQAGAYRVQGTLNEMSLNAGIREGSEVEIVSRLDPAQKWQGVVASIDYSAGSSGDNSSGGMIGGMGGVMGGGMGGMSGSTSYPFFVSLENTDGLLLGQHVYIQLHTEQVFPEGAVVLPETYLLDISGDQSSAVVLCSGTAGKLERRNVTLGVYDDNLGCYEITGGLSSDDYIADPATAAPMEGADTDLRSEQDFEQLPADPGMAEGEIVDGDGMEQDAGTGDLEG